MKEMNVEKKILKGLLVDEVLEVKAKANLEYQRETLGIRAVGPIIISGSFLTNESIKQFEEMLEMDILAPKAKLNGDEFKIEIKDICGLADDGIMLYLDLEIYGIGESREIYEELAIPVEVDDIMEKVQCINDDELVEIDQIEDLFEDANNVYTSCRLIVAKVNDSYEAIALRYGVDLQALVFTNKNKQIEPKMLIMLP